MNRKIHMIAIFFVLIGSLNLGFTGLKDIDVIKSLFPLYAKYVFIFIGVCGLSLLFKRSTYLPFLGECVFPINVLDVSHPENANITLNVPISNEYEKVIYWAANNDSDNPKDAYSSTDNVGVSEVKDGNTILHFRCPKEYKVGLFSRKLKKHIHYRGINKNNMMGKVETDFVEC
jgi:uncharacterized membrane protein YuzA (DUF378 family)